MKKDRFENAPDHSHKNKIHYTGIEIKKDGRVKNVCNLAMACMRKM